MTAFRTFLVIYLIALAAYTAVVMVEHGWNLFPYFFGDMITLNWPGQFNTDFIGFLALSAIWTAWRNQFTPAAFGLSVLAFFGGMMFLSIYLLYLSFQTEGDINRMLLGDQNPAAS